MLSRVYAIALDTFREASRAKVLYGIVVMVIGANLFALVLGQMSYGEEARVARDVGLFGVSFFGAVTAAILGVLLLWSEVQKKTIHTILSKPLERHEFVLGKFVGMVFTLTLLVALFFLALASQLALAHVPLTAAVVKGVVLGYLEVLVVAAVAVFFSSFASPALAGLFTFAVFVIGRVAPEARHAAAKAKAEWMRLVARGALWIFPDLSIFGISGGEVDGKHVSVHGDFVSWWYVGKAALFGLGWVAVLMLLAILIFRRRDFT